MICCVPNFINLGPMINITNVMQWLLSNHPKQEAFSIQKVLYTLIQSSNSSFRMCWNSNKLQICDWISDGYILSTKKFCTSRKSTKYQTLNEAKMSCFLDEECSTIYDKSCDGPPYYHCKKSSSVKSSKSSCLYSSPIDEGKFLNY